MTGIDTARATDGDATTPDRLTVGLSFAGAVGVIVYIAAWAVAGSLIDGYSPVRDAISETFAIGAPVVPATLMDIVLVATGVLLIVFGVALDRGLPGEGRGVSVASAVAGLGTIGAAVFPCTAGCPGFGTTFTDSAHVLVAGVGYVGLMVAPLLAAWRVRHHAPGLARASATLGTIALAGFIVRNLGVGDDFGGLQQRIFNTTADAWYVLAAWWIVTRGR